MERVRLSPTSPPPPCFFLTVTLPTTTHTHAHTRQLHEERERQLEEIVAEADFNHQIQMQRAEQNFRLAIRAKNREISSFRGELDAMMVALEEAGGGAALLDDGASILVYGEGKEKDGAGSFSSFAQAAQ